MAKANQKKVYVLVEDYAVDYELFINLILVTRDKKEAENKLHEMATQVKNEEDSLWDEENPQFEDFVDNPDYFSCWEDGYYARNHHTLNIHEKWVQLT